jgi:hypothetical protein
MFQETFQTLYTCIYVFYRQRLQTRSNEDEFTTSEDPIPLISPCVQSNLTRARPILSENLPSLKKWTPKMIYLHRRYSVGVTPSASLRRRHSVGVTPSASLRRAPDREASPLRLSPLSTCTACPSAPQFPGESALTLPTKLRPTAGELRTPAHARLAGCCHCFAPDTCSGRPVSKPISDATAADIPWLP